MADESGEASSSDKLSSRIGRQPVQRRNSVASTDELKAGQVSDINDEITGAAGRCSYTIQPGGRMVVISILEGLRQDLTMMEAWLGDEVPVAPEMGGGSS